MVSLSSARLHLAQFCQDANKETETREAFDFVSKLKKRKEKDVNRNPAALAASAFASENVLSYFGGPHRNLKAGINVGWPHLSSMMAANTFSAPCE